MGSSLPVTARKEDATSHATFVRPVLVADKPVKKAEGPKCSTEEYCKVEKLEIESLKKIEDMDDKNTKQMNLTKESFDKAMDDFYDDVGHLLPTREVQTFRREKEIITEVFGEGRPAIEKKLAFKTYKETVEDALREICERKAREYEIALKQEKNAPPPKKK